ncbi:MAG: rhamnogalacturonan acetylesterase, partial [Alistipes sp.]|nr:rhamnogalacturonan acetylesterase [Alistipes sp.]
MKRNILLLLGLLVATNVGAQSFKFDFTNTKKPREGFVKVTEADRYTSGTGCSYGYDLQPAPEAGST